MVDQAFLRIIVIDDNPAIHQDFKKILITEHSGEKLNELNQLLFGPNGNKPDLELPVFQMDTASQGQEGVNLIKQDLKEGKPFQV